MAPVLTGVYGALAPPLTVTMASVFLGERFHVADIGCMALILSGICIVVCVRSKEPKVGELLPYILGDLYLQHASFAVGIML